MIGWVTPYQRDFAKYPLTLHAEDLPPNLKAGRTGLAACAQEILSYSPDVLPSHVDHPQWDYHLEPFTEARHEYLSSRLGNLTDKEEAPSSLPLIDRLWWRLDGLKKRHARLHTELESVRDAHMEIMRDQVAQVSKDAEAERKELNRHFLDEFAACDATPDPRSYSFNRKLDRATGADRASTVKGAADEVLQKYKKQMLLVQEGLNDKVAKLNTALHAVYLDYEKDLLLLDQTFELDRRAVETEYRGLLQKRTRSAEIPQVRIVGGKDAHSTAAKSVLGHLKRGLLTLSRETISASYRAPLRHLREVIATSAARGAHGVLIISDGASVIEAAAERFPGMHALVSSAGARSGHLAKAFGGQDVKFDLCIWDASSMELSAFPELCEAVIPLMNSGGTVVGFDWNDDRIPPSLDDLSPPDGPVVRIHVAGFSRQITNLERFRKAVAKHGLVAVSTKLARFLAALARAAGVRQSASSRSLVGVRPPRVRGRTITVVARLHAAERVDTAERNDHELLTAIPPAPPHRIAIIPVANAR